jgi:hypothetical protein
MSSFAILDFTDKPPKKLNDLFGALFKAMEGHGMQLPINTDPFRAVERVIIQRAEPAHVEDVSKAL